MKKVLFLVMTAFLLVAPTDSLWAEEAGKEMNTMSAPSVVESPKPAGKEDMKADEMRHEKGHNHDDGMHGMMMGHHSTGWAILIGVVMVVMMAAHFL